MTGVVDHKDILRAANVFPGGCLGAFPLPRDVDFVAARGKGATVWSTDGRSYIDYVLGSGPMVLGHAHPKVVSAIADYLPRGSTYHILNQPAIDLAERIVQLVPCAESVKFVGDGSEATFYALRLARAYTNRNTILKFDGAYHGHHDYSVQSAGIPRSISDSMVVAPFNDLELACEVAESRAEDLAAVIVEPVQRSLFPMPGFLEGLRSLCDRLGALLIFDEVVTGFRLGPGGAQGVYGVRPDLCALAKIVGGGLPLGAVVGRRDVMDLSAPNHEPRGQAVYLSGTLNGNPLSAAAGLATLDVLAEDGSYSKLESVGTALRDGLVQVGRDLSVPLQVIGPPTFGSIVFGDQPISNQREWMATNQDAVAAFGVELLRRGILVRPRAKLYVSTAHTPEHIAQTLEAAAAALRVVVEKKLLN